MPRIELLAVLLPLLAAPVFAQTLPDAGGRQPLSTAPTNLGPVDTRTLWSPELPTPTVDADAPPAAFVKAAQGAIAAGRLGEAQEAIERAESRALTRSVRPSKAGEPSNQALVKQLAEARQALSDGDRMAALRTLQAALGSPGVDSKDD
jgi:hypothetical protein